MTQAPLRIDLASQASSGCSSTAGFSNHWDALVIGAGPAGAVAARELSRHGRSVLLVDKASFPRRKVCGCYLNGSALQSLAAVGLEELPWRLAAPRVGRVRLGNRNRTAGFELPLGAALSREQLDLALIEAAVEAGTTFLSKTAAKVGELADQDRLFELVSGGLSGGHRQAGRARVIVVADGVGGQSLQACQDIKFKIARASLIGVSAMTDQLPENYLSGTIHMSIGEAGYVGALQLENGLLDIAAALDPQQLRRSSPGELAQQIIQQSGLPALTGLSDLKWLGTPPLSRTPTVPAAGRLFLIGDAAGYVEPFTGEGISWALASGRAVVPFACQQMEVDSPAASRAWIAQHRRLFHRRQTVCRILTRGLRRPWLAHIGLRVLGHVPSLAKPYLSWSNRAPGLKAPS